MITNTLHLKTRLLIICALLLFASTPAIISQSLDGVSIFSNSDMQDQDDMCVWIHPDDPALSTIISSDKTANKIFVYDLDGTVIQSISVPQPGNIDLRYGFELDEQESDIIGFNDRDNGKLLFYEMDKLSGTLTRVDDENILTGDNYGFCMYVSPITAKYFAFSVDKTGKVKQFELADNGSGKISANLVRTIQLSSQCEGLVCDDEMANLFVGEEDEGIYKFGAEPGDSDAGQKIISIGDGGLSADVEGITIYYGSLGKGYIIASSQGNASFKIYERSEPHNYIGSFSINGVTNSDGIDICNIPLNEDFDSGIFLCHNGAGTGPYEQVALNLNQIASVVDEFITEPGYWNPREKHTYINEGPKEYTKRIFLSEIDWLSANAGEDKSPLRNLNADGTPMQLADTLYLHGIGTYANSLIEYDLAENYEHFYAIIGLDKSSVDDSFGSVVFRIMADGNEVYNSGPIDYQSEASVTSLDVEGVNSLVLAVDDNGDGTEGDLANWANAILVPVTPGYTPPVWGDEAPPPEDGYKIHAKVDIINWDRLKFQWTGGEGSQYMFYFKGNGNTTVWEYFFKGENYKKEGSYNYTYVNGLCAGETYRMYVTYRYPKENRWANRSNPVEFTMPEKSGTTKPPVLKDITALSHKRVKITWADSASNEYSYRLERKGGGKDEFEQIARLDANDTSFVNYGLQPNTSYTYRVVVYSKEGRFVSGEGVVTTPAFEGDSETLLAWQVAEPYTHIKYHPKVSDIWIGGDTNDDGGTQTAAKKFHADRVTPMNKDWDLAWKIRNIDKAVGFNIHQEEKDGWNFVFANNAKWDKYDCMNDPNLRHVFYSGHANIRIANGQESYIKYGGGNYQFAVGNGVCYCPYCKYQAYKQGFDISVREEMLEFQRQTTVNFYEYQSQKMYLQHWQNLERKGWDYYNISVNTYERTWDAPGYNEILAMWDYGNADLSADNCKPSVLYSHALNSKEYNKFRVWRMRQGDKNLLRAGIATAYAIGTPAYAPWGYGLKKSASDYADLFGFFKALSEYYDNYEDAAVAGYDMPEELRYGDSKPISITGGNGKVTAMLKAVPDDPDAAVIIHLIDFGNPQSFKLHVLKKHLFTDSNIKAGLFVPKEYNEAEHNTVEGTKDFSDLAKMLEIDIEYGDTIVFHVPSLNPNGMILIRKVEGEGNMDPEASFYTSASTNNPAKIFFNASGSNDPDGDPLFYEWDFGDGKVDNEEITDHIYSESGQYIVKLKVYDGYGGSDEMTSTIDIDLTSVNGVSVADFEIYPNPTSGLVLFKGLAADAEITIFALTGELIYMTKLYGNEADLSHLLPGAYFIKSGGNISKIIKN